METPTCPQCGYPREPKALDCPVCGIVFAKYRAAAPAGLRPEPAAVPPPLPTLNPYAPPQAAVSVTSPPLPQAGLAGVWRSGDVLVVRKGYPLPGRCVVCNQPTGNRWQKTHYWVPLGIRLLILLHVIIYLIAYLIVRKSADLAIPLCGDHARKRSRDTMLSWVLVIGGLALFFGIAFATDSPRLLATIITLALTGLITGIVLSVKANVVKPVKIDNDYVWLKKVSPAFLSGLPEVAGNL